ncbi:hypothetical protein ACYSNR_02075 [Enterococcus sp. LJL128]
MTTHEAVKKVLSCHTNGNFITAPDLHIKQITPKIMNQFLEATNLVWSVVSFGPVLGVGAFFYERNNEIDNVTNNIAQQVEGRIPIGDADFQQLKIDWEC